MLSKFLRESLGVEVLIIELRDIVHEGLVLGCAAGGGYEGSYTGPKNVIPLVDAKLDKGTLSFSNGSGRFSGRWDETRKAWVGQWAFQVQWIAGPSNAPAPSLSSPLVLTAGKP